MVKELDQADSTGNANTELQTVIVLPSGKVAIKKNLKSREYFSYKSSLIAGKGKNVADGTTQLMIKMFQVNGQDLTVDLIDELSFEDAAVLDGVINEIFLQSQQART